MWGRLRNEEVSLKTVCGGYRGLRPRLKCQVLFCLCASQLSLDPHPEGSVAEGGVTQPLALPCWDSSQPSWRRRGSSWGGQDTTSKVGDGWQGL